MAASTSVSGPVVASRRTIGKAEIRRRLAAALDFVPAPVQQNETQAQAWSLARQWADRLVDLGRAIRDSRWAADVRDGDNGLTGALLAWTVRLADADYVLEFVRRRLASGVTTLPSEIEARREDAAGTWVEFEDRLQRPLHQLLSAPATTLRAAKEELRRQIEAVLGDGPPTAPLAGTTPLSARDLAKKYCVSVNALTVRLNRYRPTDMDCYTESANPGRNRPRFLYYEDKVLHVIAAMKRNAQKRHATT
ncbi:MAG TPA: hypothetical protein VGF55_29740 [Gemmataceae bacterium]|jgi:hypothetical protein